MTTYGQALRVATERLRLAGVPSPEWDARLLMAHLIHCPHMSIPLHDEAMPGFDVAFAALLARREAREPLQYIMGTAPFGPLELSVGPGVFIPRPETEVLADWAVRHLHEQSISHPVVIDLCTGSGALAGYIKHEFPQAQVWAVELSDVALEYARTNLGAVSEEIRLIHADVTSHELIDLIGCQADVIVTNPPYVPRTQDLEPEVYHDPDSAVFGGDDGLSVIKPMLPIIAALSRPGAWVGMEHDDETSAQVIAAFESSGFFEGVKAMNDLNGVHRFVTAVRKG